MQLKNPLVFGLVAVLLVGGTILPAMSQTEPEDISQIQVTVDNSTYDLNEPITTISYTHLTLPTILLV